MKVSLDKIKGESSKPPPGLIRSLKEFGLCVPIILVRDGEHYNIVAGRRRVAGLRETGVEEVDAHVLEGDVGAMGTATVSLLENLQRSPNPAVEAEHLKTLIDGGMSPKEITAKLGISRAKISQRLKLLHLAPGLFSRVKSGEIPASTAYQLTKLTRDVQEELSDEKKITAQEVKARIRHKQMALMDLDSIEIPPPEGNGLADQVEAEAMKRTGKERDVLLQAAEILKKTLDKPA